MREKPAITTGSPCAVKINGEFTPATYVDWSDKYNLPIVMVEGRRMYRRIFDADATAVLRARPADRSVPLIDRLPPPPAPSESDRPSLLAMNRVRVVPLNTRLREGDIIDHYGARATVVRVSDCSADVELPRQAREITTRDGDSRTVIGSPRVIRISPNSELPILGRR
jgi:hypothetical protein